MSNAFGFRFPRYWPEDESDGCPQCGKPLRPAIPPDSEDAIAVLCVDCGWNATRIACARCGEGFTRDEGGEYIHPGFFHTECAARMVIGGMNHLLRRCTCCGGTEPPDPPDLTKREAARNALAVFRAQQAQRGNGNEDS